MQSIKSGNRRADDMRHMRDNRKDKKDTRRELKQYARTYRNGIQ